MRRADAFAPCRCAFAYFRRQQAAEPPSSLSSVFTQCIIRHFCASHCIRQQAITASLIYLHGIESAASRFASGHAKNDCTQIRRFIYSMYFSDCRQIEPMTVFRAEDIDAGRRFH